MGLQIPKRPPERLAGRSPKGAVVRVGPEQPPGSTDARSAWASSGTYRSLAVAFLCACAFALWDTGLFLPIRLLVVTFHELGHAFLAVLTGGEVLALGVGLDESGITVTRGGNPFYVLNGGYLGSIVVGLVLLVASPSPQHSRVAAGGLGIVLAMVAVRHFSVDPVGLSVVLVCAVCLMGLATHSPRWLTELVTRTLGWFSLLYSLFDIRDDVFRPDGPDPRSDAAALEALTGVAAPVWGVSWVVVGLSLLWAVCRRLR